MALRKFVCTRWRLDVVGGSGENIVFHGYEDKFSCQVSTAHLAPNIQNFFKWSIFAYYTKGTIY